MRMPAPAVSPQPVFTFSRPAITPWCQGHRKSSEVPALCLFEHRLPVPWQHFIRAMGSGEGFSFSRGRSILFLLQIKPNALLAAIYETVPAWQNLQGLPSCFIGLIGVTTVRWARNQ
jgi:hypothetical protein